jgi:hypothetical protein
MGSTPFIQCGVPHRLWASERGDFAGSPLAGYQKTNRSLPNARSTNKRANPPSRRSPRSGD